MDKSTAAGLVGLLYLARQAFEERRPKQCLDVTSAILKIEPEHTEALTIRTSTQSQLDQDFAAAKALVKEAGSKSDRVLYARAEAALRRIVDADPENLEAKTLLLDTVTSGYFCPSSDSARPGRRVRRRAILIGSGAVVVLVAALALRSGTVSNVSAGTPVTIQPPSFPLAPSSSAGGDLPQIAVDTVVAGDQPIAVSVKPARIDKQPAPLQTEEPDGTSRTTPDGDAASAMGILAVSASVPVEIYRGEEHLGSTPTTLQLPAGLQTLEYRYQGLRQTLSHVIRNQETTAASITFPIKVQINARPWAQVFLDGVQLTPIGQTPLGNVSVPIGSVLVFQNPSFPDKRYRVTARDASIQVNFP